MISNTYFFFIPRAISTPAWKLYSLAFCRFDRIEGALLYNPGLSLTIFRRVRISRQTPGAISRDPLAGEQNYIASDLRLIVIRIYPCYFSSANVSIFIRGCHVSSHYFPLIILIACTHLELKIPSQIDSCTSHGVNESFIRVESCRIGRKLEGELN